MTSALWDASALRDPETERAFLGAVWTSAGRVLSDTEVVVDDFQDAPYRRLWQAFTEMWADGAPFDLAAVRQQLGDDFTRVAGALTELVTSGAVAQSAGWHAATLIRLTAHRRAHEAVTRIAQKATGDVDPEELAEFARGQIDQAMAARGVAPAESWGEHLDRAVTRWQSPVTDAISTGWWDLDELLSGNGLRPGHLTVIGARPGVGKSLVATMLAGTVASEGLGVYFASVEMSADELTDRIAAAATGVNLADLTNRCLTPEQMELLRVGVKRIRRWPLTLDDKVTSIAQVRRGVRNKSREPGGVRLVIVDYLQLMEGADRKLPRHEQVAGMSRAMKLIGKEFGVPVVLLSQLNRGSVQRESKQPMISDLRESGAVEQDADEIILLHRDEDDTEMLGLIQLHLAKNRHGPVGHVKLAWKPYVSRITNQVGVVRRTRPVVDHSPPESLADVAGSKLQRSTPVEDRYWRENDSRVDLLSNPATQAVNAGAEWGLEAPESPAPVPVHPPEAPEAPEGDLLTAEDEPPEDEPEGRWDLDHGGSYADPIF